ncbi:hypothetical protein B7463_g5043, partial [Scytalidium lignicola]
MDGASQGLHGRARATYRTGTLARCIEMLRFAFHPKRHSTSTLNLSLNRIPSDIKMSTATPTKLRSLYRAFLRELPPRPLPERSRTPLQKRIRESIESTTTRSSIVEAEQYLRYVKAQRMYATLVERYNPGMDMEEEERVRLTARRVGMTLPKEFLTEKKEE